MKAVVKCISFVALAMALHSGLSTMALLIPDLYPSQEMTERVRHLVFIEALIAFAMMLACWLAARAIPKTTDHSQRS